MTSPPVPAQLPTAALPVRPDVTVVRAEGPLVGAVEDLTRRAMAALAELPRAVVYDLSAADADAEAAPEVAAVHRLVAAATPLAREWPGTLLALVAAHPAVRAVLHRTATGGPLLVRATSDGVLAELDARPEPAVALVRLGATPLASRAARSFVAETCRAWHLPYAVEAASLVVSELVTNGIVHAGTDVEVSLAWYGDTLRVAVRDGTSDLPSPQQADPWRTGGRGLVIVSAFSRAWGVLPTGDGGKAVWAVLTVDQPG